MKIQKLRDDINELIKTQQGQHVNDPAVYKVWERMTLKLSANISNSIKYMEELSEEDLDWVSQVFDDIILKTNSL